jgi:hypothetical protein
MIRLAIRFWFTEMFDYTKVSVNQMSSFAERQILQCQKEHVHNHNDLQNTTKQLKIKQYESH